MGILESIRSAIRYAAVGGSVAALDVVFFYVLADRAALPYLIVNMVGFVLGTVVNYLLSITFVFCSGARFQQRAEIALVCAASGVGLVLNQGILAALVELGNVPVTPAKAITVATVFLWNYCIRAYLIFEPKQVAKVISDEALDSRGSQSSFSA